MRVNFETERLKFRNLVPEDCEAAFVWCGDPEVNKFMIYPLYTNVEDVRNWIMSLNIDAEGTYDCGIIIKETNELIGSYSLVNNPERNAWEIGYNIRKDKWGNGFVPEAILGLIEYVKRNEEVNAIDGVFAEENIKSRRVMEKLGMTYQSDTKYEKLDGSASFKAKLYRRDF